MAIAHDTTTTAAAYTSTGTQTTSHAASGSARGAVVLIDQNGAITDQVSGVTYGGVEMKRLRFDTENTEAGGVYIYWLDEVPTGTQNVAMTTTATANKQLSVSTMTVTSGKVVRPVGTGNTATSASGSNPALTLSGLTASTVYQAYEVIHSGLTTMTATPQTSPAWTLISSTDLGAQGRGFARINNTPGGTTITAGWIAATADDYVISGVAFYETDPPSADGLPNGGLAAWWAADDLAYADNDPVTTWADRVTGLALEEATNPPTFKTSILNSLPAVRFSTSGTDESLQTAATVPLFNSVRGGTVFVVGLSTAPQATFQTFFATDTVTAGTDRFSVYATATDGYLGQYGRRLDADGLTSKPSTTVAPSTADIIRAVSDWGAGTYDLRIGGTSVGSGAYTSAGTTSFVNANKFRVGRSNTATYGLEGDIYEVIVYERVLTSGEITTVEDYLTAKWLTPAGTNAPAEAVTLTATAHTPAVAIVPTVEAATATASALDATVSTATATEAPAEAATATATANDATVTIGAFPSAATATGTANNAAPALAIPGGSASATVAAGDAQGGAGANAATATATATAATPSTQVVVNAEAATATASAQDPTVSTVTATNAAAETATATASALDASVAVTVLAESATATAAAQDATVSTVPAVNASAEAASATATANTAAASLAVNAECATATAAAQDATVSTVTATNAPAEAATATATAASPTAALRVNAECATASAAALSPAAATAAVAQAAAATIASLDAMSAIAAAVDAALATITSDDATVTTVQPQSGGSASVTVPASPSVLVTAGASPGLTPGTAAAATATPTRTTGPTVTTTVPASPTIT